MKICNLRVNGKRGNLYVDENPTVSFYIESDNLGAMLKSYFVTLFDESGKTLWESGTIESAESFGIKLQGTLENYSKYSVKVEAEDSFEEKDEASIEFSTAKVNCGFSGKWITDGEYTFESGSPVPFVFKKEFLAEKKLKKAEIYATAYGIYTLVLNDERVGNEYLTPYFTSMNKVLQYQVYDVTESLKENNVLFAEVSGGWACGRYGLSNSNKNFTDKQYFLADIVLTYEDGEREVVGTDSSWGIARGGRYSFADIYDGVVFDANVDLNTLSYKNADEVPSPKNAELKATFGEKVLLHEVFKPISIKKSEKGYIYDFGQNLAGLVRFTVNAKNGQKITVRHGEILSNKGEICYGPLRTAKATVEYTAKDGKQTFIADHTYMGYRYVEVMGCDKDDIEVESVALYSDFDVIGGFECSDPTLTRLQKNIEWGGKSNFVDIPTDCPQRDERLGWTGDIAVFSRTAAFNFDMTRFFDKWLNDVRLDQTENGGLAAVIPKVSLGGQGQRKDGNDNASCGWGECCIMVPYAEFMARGDKALLSRQYDSMKKFIECVLNEGILSKHGYKKYIWVKPMLYGDWCAPEEAMLQWFGKRKWLYTIYLFNSLKMLEYFAKNLGKTDDEKYYGDLAEKVREAFIKKLTDGKGKMTKEFQSGYTCALTFGIYPDEETRKAFAENLARLVKEKNYHLATGFLGTPYLLFALCDNGYKDVAYKVLMQDTFPSWLYEIKQGGTTVWERWDGILEDGAINDAPLQPFKYKKPTNTGGDGTKGMLSFNHYAYGAVGDFLYRRVAGIEANAPMYKKFTVKPEIGGGLTYANAHTECPYGKISSGWKIENGNVVINVEVPCGTSADVVMPSGKINTVSSGKYTFSEELR